MSNRLRALYLGLATVTTLGVPAIATPAFAVDLTVSCRCVEGGANSNDAVWIKTKVIPAFTEQMKAAGKDVTVRSPCRTMRPFSMTTACAVWPSTRRQSLPLASW